MRYCALSSCHLVIGIALLRMKGEVMRYTVRRISLGSAAKVGLALGWLVALCPALCLAGVAIQVLRRVSAALGQIRSFDIGVLGQTIATIDLVSLLGLSGA